MSQMSRPVRADWGILVLASAVILGGFILLAVERIVWDEFLTIVLPVLTFYFGRVNGRASNGK